MKNFFAICVLLVNSVVVLAQQEIKLTSSYNLDPVRFAEIKVGDKKVSTDVYGLVNYNFKQVDTIYIFHRDYEYLAFPTSEIKVGVTEILLTSTVQTYSEYVVEPLPWQQGESEYPGYIQVLNPKEIELSNPQTAADLLTVGDQVYVQKSQLGGGSPMLRGLSTNRILLSIDGVRMNTAIFRSGNLQNAILIDPNAIAKAEVIFGPGTVNYGSDALGGVMDFKTLVAQPDSTVKKKWKANVLGRLSTANLEQTIHTDLVYTGAKFAALSSFTYSNFADLKMGSRGLDEYQRRKYATRINGKDTIVENSDPNVQVGTAYSQINLMQKFAYQGKKGWLYTLSSIYSESSDIPRYDRLIETKGDVFKSAEWKYGPQKWWMNQFVAMGKLKSVFANEMKISVANQWFEESRIDRKFGDDERRIRTEKVNAASVNIDFNKEFSATTKLFYGFEAIHNLVLSEGITQNINTNQTKLVASRYPNSEWMSFAGYLSFQHWVNKYWHISSGVRYNQVVLNANFDNSFYNFPFQEARQNNGALTGSLGATYRFNGFMYGLNLSTGFRAPNVDDIGKIFDSEPGEVIVPNLNLRPEYIYSVDGNFKKEFENDISLSTTVFYSFLNNIIVRDDFTFNGADSIVYDGVLSQVNALQNKDYAQIYGLTASITLPIINSLFWRNTFNYTDGYDKNNVPLRHVSPTFGASHLYYKKSRWLADFYVRYNFEMENEDLSPSEQDKEFIYTKDENGLPYAPAWHTFNFKVSYQPVSTLTVIVGVENLLDLRYRPYSSGIVAPGRNFIASIKLSL
ncbi:MAG: TonB-dependent receptor plug domain-containing protein [Lishizhenia sp.]